MNRWKMRSPVNLGTDTEVDNEKPWMLVVAVCSLIAGLVVFLGIFLPGLYTEDAAALGEGVHSYKLERLNAHLNPSEMTKLPGSHQQQVTGMKNTQDPEQPQAQGGFFVFHMIRRVVWNAEEQQDGEKNSAKPTANSRGQATGQGQLGPLKPQSRRDESSNGEVKKEDSEAKKEGELATIRTSELAARMREKLLKSMHKPSIEKIDAPKMMASINNNNHDSGAASNEIVDKKSHDKDPKEALKRDPIFKLLLANNAHGDTNSIK